MKPRTVAEWTAHWNARASIDDPIERTGLCLNGAPIDRELWSAAAIQPWLERLELECHQHVLDVGCGSGLLLREIEKRVERAVGTDISEAQIRSYEGTAETYVCAADELPFEGRQFDRIVMASVCHYFPSHDYFRDVVVKLLRLLRRDGLLLIADLPLGRQPPATPYLWYDPAGLIDVLEPLDVGFSIETQSELKRSINRRYDIVVRTGSDR